MIRREPRDLEVLLKLPDCAQLSTEEAAIFLDRASITLHRWRKDGGGPPFIRISRFIAYLKSDLVEWRGKRRYRDRAHEMDEAARRKQAELLDPGTTGFSFQALDDKRRPDGKPRDNAKLRQTMHGNLATHVAHLIRLNTKFGAAIYVVINKTDLKGRLATNVVKVRALWADLDHGLPAQWALRPSIVVQTSPGKYQAYWLVDGELSFADALGILRNLTLTYGGDPGVNTIERILRVPGFYHQKGEPFLVAIVEATGRRYTVAELTTVHPPIIEQRKAAPLPAEIPECARNRTLISAAGRMRKQGFPVETIEAALQDLNMRACSPPLDEKEVSKIVNSSGRWPPGELVQDDNADAVVSHLKLALRFSDRHADDARYVA